jgi:hypothetical protein
VSGTVTVRFESDAGVVPTMSPPSPADDTSDDADRPVEFDPPTDDGTEADDEPSTDDGRSTADGHAEHDAEGPAKTTTESIRRTLDTHLPDADVDSNWWYGVAAVPVYFLVTFVGGAVAAVVFLFAGFLDVAGLGGLASASTFVLVAGAAALFGLVGVVVAVVFPVALYVDARAVEDIGGEWTPDPVLWGLLAVVAVVVTNFVLSVPLAVYYLYRRHEAVGVP